MGYGSFVWGFIFLFDINIGGFDILPDFVAYIFFIVGLKTLKKLNDHFERANTLSIILLVVSLFFLFIRSIQLGGFEWIIGLGVTIVSVMHIYSLCMGIEEEAIKHDLLGLADLTRKRWRLYLMVICSLFIAAFLPHPIIMMLVFVFAIVSYGLMIDLMSRANRELKQELYVNPIDY